MQKNATGSSFEQNCLALGTYCRPTRFRHQRVITARPCDAGCTRAWLRALGEDTMASTQTSRGRKQDRARVAGGQRHEVSYEAKKAGKSGEAVKHAVKKVGVSRKKVEAELGK